MSYKINITEEAFNDMDNIYDYIANYLYEPKIAEGILNKLEKSITGLDEMPFKFRKYEEEPWKSRGMHIMQVGNYVVLYTPDKEKQVVTVNRVFYGGMDIPSNM